MSLVLTKKTENNWLCVTLNRPEKRNALNPELILDLVSTFLNIKKQNDLKGVLLKGEGLCFSAGADLNWLRENKKDSHLLFDLLEMVSQSSIPVVAYAHGQIYGGGVGLLCACDWVCAEKNTKFCFSEVRLGLIPSIITPFVLKKIPFPKTKALMLAAEVFATKEAFDLGLVSYTDSQKKCAKWIEEKITSLNHLDLNAFNKTKKLLNTFFPTEKQKEICIQTLDEQRNDPRVREKILQFLNQ